MTAPAGARRGVGEEDAVAREVVRWASGEGLFAMLPEAFPESPVWDHPAIDFGNIYRKVPRFVLRPANVDALRRAVAHLTERQVPYTVRGNSHCSGGQTLTEEGGVIDLRLLAGVVDDQPAREQVTVLGGTWWQALCDHLRPQGRRPVSLIDNTQTTVAGTLSVGGFGDTSHRYGLQVDTVRALSVVTPDGALHRVGPGDELFDFTLAGRGQLGVIGEVTLGTLRRPHVLAGYDLHWASLEEGIAGAMRNRELGRYEVFRQRLQFQEATPRVSGFAAELRDRSGPPHEVADHLGAARAEPVEIDQVKQAEWNQAFGYDWKLGWDWSQACPAMEVVLPWPAGEPALRRIHRQLFESGLSRWCPGSSLMLVPGRSRLPLAPLPGSEDAVMLALRPSMPPSELPRWLPLVRRIGAESLEAGGRVYLMSLDLDMDPERFLELQWGEAGRRLRALKARFDPGGLLNRGLLPIG